MDDAFDAVMQAYLDVAAEQVTIAADELESLVAARAGLDPDDSETEALFDEIDEELMSDDRAAVTMLPPDLIVHAPTLMAGAVLTHRLSAPEQAEGFLVVDTDLAGFQRYPAPCVDDRPLDVHDGAWTGDEDWFTGFPAGALLAVRMADDGAVSVSVIAEEPVADADLVALVRASYDAEMAEPGLPVCAEDILLGMRLRDPKAFSLPGPPLEELAAAAGLERRGHQFAHEEAVWEQEVELQRHFRMLARLGSAASAFPAMEALSLLENPADPAGLRRALDLLQDPDALLAVVEELVGQESDDEVSALAAMADRLVAVAGRSLRAAVAQLIAAMAAERGGRVLDAESHLRAASNEAGGWPFIEDRLAWYESDRGEAAAALGRWQAAGAPDSHPDIVMVSRFVAAAQGPEPGRNDPCWCESGRKFKQCHRGKGQAAPLPERVGWLYRKAIAYVERRGGAAEVEMRMHAAVRAGEDDLETGMTARLTVDVVLHEGGWLARFLDERGPLLPEDEALLVASWLLVDRTVYEVLDVEAGVGIGLRDLRTGDRVEVTERTASRTVTPGMLLCARAVPDGVGNQLVGDVIPVEPGRERALLALLDDGDGLDLLDWEAARTAPMQIVGPDGAELVHCTAQVQVGRYVVNVLDELYEASFGGDDDTGSWVSYDERDRVLALLDLADDVLTVRALSEERMDRTLAEVISEVPGARVLSDDRIRPDPDAAPVAAAGPPPEIPPEQLAEIQEGIERRWCDEHVPALDGYTPREAAADPTRRGDVIRLIASFPEIDPTTGAFGMRPRRLRELLDLH